MKKQILMIALLLTSSAAFAETVYDNTASVNGTIGDFGNPNTSTYGQTFAVPVIDTQLNTFSVFLNAGSSGQLQGYVGSWTGSGVGSILYTSGLVTVTGSDQEFDFNTGGLDLVGGGTYVAFISNAGPEYSSYVGATTTPSVFGGGTIPGGNFVYINNTGDPSQFLSTSWVSFTGGDEQFKADFGSPSSVTPEPSSLMLLGTGLAGLVGALRRKLA